VIGVLSKKREKMSEWKKIVEFLSEKRDPERLPNLSFLILIFNPISLLLFG
jgi:hypothetical protein